MGPDAGIFRALIERCPMVTYQCDPDGAITYISPQIEAWTGLPARLWTKDPEHWHRMLHPEDRERIVAADRASYRGGPPLDVEYRFLCPNGRVIWAWEQEVRLPGEESSHGIVLDITALRTAQVELEAAQARLAAVVNAAPVVLFATDADGRITLSEGKALEALGSSPGAQVGEPIHRLFPGRPDVHEHVARALAGESFETRTELGELVFDCAWRGTPGGGLIGTAIDVTARRRSEERLAHLAFHDPLTGLPNRRTAEEQLDRELARARRHGEAVAALYIDLDHFKLVNDSLGHAAGDEVLRQVAARIRAVTRAGDVLARLGGDEFLLLCPRLGVDAGGAAGRAAAKILDALDETLLIEGAEFQLGASIGVALGPRDGDDAATLLRHADAAMYEAKRSGRDAYAAYRPERRDPRVQLTLTVRLRRALTDDEFVLHFQPIHDLGTGRLHGAEALVRWQDPDAGLVGPGAFIPHAEETGLITRIGAWVMAAACRQAAAWREAGAAPLVAFNASPRELRDDGYVDRVAAALAVHGLPAHGIMIEVTESAMHESARTRGVIEALHELGVLLALDDFGTEHSSLSRLRELPVQVLKVDSSFLRDVPGDPSSAAIVQAIATLGGGLDMHVVAEGIETPAQLAFAAQAGCQYGQGYHLARPGPPEAMLEALTSRRAPTPRAARVPARSPAGLPRS